MRSALARAAIRRGSSTMIFLFFAQELIEQRQRHPRRLARAGRRDQNGGVAVMKRARQFVEYRVDRKGGVEGTSQFVDPLSSAKACAGRPPPVANAIIAVWMKQLPMVNDR